VEPCAERGPWAAILSVGDELGRDGPAVTLNPLGGAVARAVVDDEQPAACREELRARLEILEEARQVLDLVEGGDDEQVRNRRADARPARPRRLVRGVAVAE